MAELLTIVTGAEWTSEQMAEIGRRVGRAFNQREGFDRRHDTVPKRVVTEALQNGPAKGQVIPQEVFDDMLSQYYEVMGWDENGIMPEELIASLL